MCTVRVLIEDFERRPERCVFRGRERWGKALVIVDEEAFACEV